MPETTSVDEVAVDEEVEEMSSPPSALTPGQGAVPIRFAVPVVSGVALLSALAALELTKRPRRMPSGVEAPTGPERNGGAA